MYALCTYKPRDNSGPAFVALVPQQEERSEDAGGKQSRPPGFSLVHLPFVDDLRAVPTEAGLVEPDPEQVQYGTSR